MLLTLPVPRSVPQTAGPTASALHRLAHVSELGARPLQAIPRQPRPEVLHAHRRGRRVQSVSPILPRPRDDGVNVPSPRAVVDSATTRL
jgi:hypothetical protein